MSLFDISFSSSYFLAGYLKRLGVNQAAPDLKLLNELIQAHQSIIPFENFTRIIDFKERSAKFSNIEESLQNILDGNGGVCWSQARSFHWLLKELGFKTQYLYMEPGHVCLKVTLDQDYYVDVGYAAPFFEAQKLNQSFTVKTISEEFVFTLGEADAQVVRTPGPTKRLILKPFEHQQIETEFLKGNNWGENRFLSETVILKYVDQKLVRLYGKTFLDYRSGTKTERLLDDEEIVSILGDVFQISPDLYFKARSYLT